MPMPCDSSVTACLMQRQRQDSSYSGCAVIPRRPSLERGESFTFMLSSSTTDGSSTQHINVLIVHRLSPSSYLVTTNSQPHMVGKCERFPSQFAWRTLLTLRPSVHCFI